MGNRISLEKGIIGMQTFKDEKSSAKSIKVRLVGNFLIIIFFSVAAFEGMLIFFTRYYFYNNVESVLTNQIKVASDFYQRYFSNVSLEANILDDVDVFWKQTTAQVQIVDTTGRVLMDSVGVSNREQVSSVDFQAALKGEKGILIGKLKHSQDKVMVVSYPLQANGKVVGVLRFITSLKEIDKIVINICMIFIGIGIIVILVAMIISLFLAYSIIHPLKEVTYAAELMAKGNLKIRISKQRDDEIGSLADTLNYMAEEIQNRDAIKNEFISLVSHELRTPLTSIKGWAITLNTDEFEDKEILKDGLKIIEKESDRLSVMVEELLDFSSFVSGKVVLKKESTDLREIIEYIEKYMSPKAKREGIDFSVICNPLPQIEIDRDRIKQVLINLLGNSFKFTSRGGAVILKAYAENFDIILSVEDTGAGISAEDLPRVKEKFYKGKNSKSQTGLGLSICDEIVKMHKGSINIESELNKGTLVTVRLPIEINSKGEREHEREI